MNKYAKIMLVLFTLGAVAAIMFRPSGELMSRNDSTEKSYLEVYQEAINNNQPLLIEFYSRY